MNQNHRQKRKGFTLIEILLVIVAIGVLALIVLVAINPNRQISQVRNAQRRSDVNTIYKAIEQYSIDNGVYPTSIPTGQYKEICAEGISEECVDLGVLVPTYLAGIPTDPIGGNYKVGINPDNNRISVFSELSENAEIAVNKFTVPIIVLAGAKDPSFDAGVAVGFDNIVYTQALQSDGKIIAGGDFTSYQGLEVNRISRLNSDGSRDTSFNIGTGFNGTVRAISMQSDGKIVVGGSFTSYNGVTVNRISRLNSDGSRDTSFNIGT